MTKVKLLILNSYLQLCALYKILKIMPVDAYNDGIITSRMLTHTYYAQNYAYRHNLPTPTPHRNVVVINEDGSTCCLNDTEHRQSERELACTSMTNCTNLHRVTIKDMKTLIFS